MPAGTTRSVDRLDSASSVATAPAHSECQEADAQEAQRRRFRYRGDEAAATTGSAPSTAKVAAYACTADIDCQFGASRQIEVAIHDCAEPAIRSAAGTALCTSRRDIVEFRHR